MNSNLKQTNLLHPQKLFIDDPIYSQYDISELSKEDIFRIEFFEGSLDAYCIDCKNASIFEGKSEYNKPIYRGGVPIPIRNTEEAIRNLEEKDAHLDRSFEIEMNCSRNKDHRILFFFLVRNDNLIKVGQYPSIADFELPKLNRFRSILDKKQRKEFARAIGLSAHGVGVGSFVYLRRIFEFLIEKAHQEIKKKEKDWNEAEYHKKRMDEKIPILENYLPLALVENARLYSILSKGIHLLEEDECLKYFEVIKGAIDLILEEELEKTEKEKNAKRLSQEIARIKGNIK